MLAWLTGFRLYIALALAVAFIGMGIAIKVQTERLRSLRAEYAAFQAQVEAIGRAQIAANKLKYQTDLALKGKLDYENKTLRSNLADTARRMSDARSGRGYLSDIPASAGSPAITADPARLENAIRTFDTAVAAIVDAGDSAIADLNTAKQWVSEQKQQGQP